MGNCCSVVECCHLHDFKPCDAAPSAVGNTYREGGRAGELNGPCNSVSPEKNCCKRRRAKKLEVAAFLRRHVGHFREVIVALITAFIVCRA